MAWIAHVITLLSAYLLGSIPTGYVVARARGVDIRTVGSGNIGATNVFRMLGRTAGSLVLAADFLKGLLACLILGHGLGLLFYPGVTLGSRELESLEVVAGIGAVLGHNYTCWLHFKGGKGIATSAGVLVAWVPKALLIILIAWVLVFVLSRYVSLASVIAASTLPFATWLTGSSVTFILLTAGLALLAVLKHRANLRRLLNGSEHRVEWKRSRKQA